MTYGLLISAFLLLGSSSYVHGDCYPGDSAFTAIVQEIYNGVTRDSISFPSGKLTRSQLCNILVNHHNNERNSGQSLTNRVFLFNFHISHSSCMNALTYTQGYYGTAGWSKRDGHHSGKWYDQSQIFHDDAEWFTPYQRSDSQHTYAVQKVRFDSQWRKDHCHTPDTTGSTCRYGWNQSGNGIQCVWGWDPKNDDCPVGYHKGRTGAHVGFTFTEGTADCIVWVTTEEAFLECVRYGRRTSARAPRPGYGQWTIS